MMDICTGSSTTSNAISLHFHFKKAMSESISDAFKNVKDNVVYCVNFHDILHCNTFIKKPQMKVPNFYTKNMSI